jgi:hypothetical protein
VLAEGAAAEHLGCVPACRRRADCCHPS